MTALLLVAALAAAEEGAASAEPAAVPTTAVHASLTLQVPEPRAVLDRVAALAEERGGWFSRLDDDGITVRVPVDAAEACLDAAAGLGRAVERAWTTDDLGRELVDVRARLQAREELLARYREVLEEAGPDSVVAVEHEITRTIGEIEGLRGRLRALEQRARYAEIDVSLVFRDLRPPVRGGESSFAWINTLSMPGLVDDFRWGRRSTPSRARAEVPDGFAPYPGRRRFRAASPDGVVYRVRSVRHRPRADLDFWRAAVRTALRDSGYRVVADEEIEVDGVRGGLLELAAASGPEQRTWIVAFFPRGRRIVVAEATGEAGAMAARREAVLAAIRAIRW